MLLAGQDRASWGLIVSPERHGKTTQKRGNGNENEMVGVKPCTWKTAFVALSMQTVSTEEINDLVE